MRLADHVFVADIDGRAVVLDLARDRYFALNPDLSRELRGLLAMEGGAPDAALRDRACAVLVRQGILTTDARPSNRRAAPLLETALWPSLATVDAPHLGLQVSALLALNAASASLRLRPISGTVAWLSRRKRRSPADVRRRPEALLRAYRAARPGFPEKPICRLDALGLVLFLNRHGHPADLVFGVRLEPFQAHCWAQLGAAAVNEPVDSLRQYVPIMIV